MKHHKIKILSKYFKEVVKNNKNFELRKNDRDYQAGDMVTLQDYENGQYTGLEKTVTIKYVLKDCPEFGLYDGFCIFGW